MTTPPKPHDDAQAPEDVLAARDLHAVEDRAEAAARIRRGYMQIRATFVQKPSGPDRAGTLALFVQNRQVRPLLLYMMLLNVWPWLESEAKPLEAAAWMSLLHSRLSITDRDVQSLTWSESTLSRAWKWLLDNGLVEKSRGKHSRALVKPRREDAAAAYTAPSGSPKDWNDVYFTLPDRFWSEQDFARLSLPGLAMLLVIAKETNKASEFRGTFEQIAEWYGFGRSTVAKGIADLRDHGLLSARVVNIPARLSKVRFTTETWYSLTGDYSRGSRLTARRNANRRRRRSEAPAGTGSRKAGSQPSAGQPRSPKFTSIGGGDPDGRRQS